MGDDVQSISAKSKDSAGGSSKKKGKEYGKRKSKIEDAAVVDHTATEPRKDIITKDDQPEHHHQNGPTEEKVGGGGEEKRKSGEESVKSKKSSLKHDVRKSIQDKADIGEAATAAAPAATVPEKEHRQESRKTKGKLAEDATITPSPKKTIVQGADVAAIFRVTNPEIQPLGRKTLLNINPALVTNTEDGKSDGSGKKQRQSRNPAPPLTAKLPPPPPSSIEEEFLEIEDETMSYDEEGYRYLEYESKEEEDLFGEEEDELFERKRSRRSLLREKWENISAQISQTFNSPSRVFKLRGYHSEPDLSLPFEDKFDLNWTVPVRYHQTREDNMDDGDEGWGELRRIGEKFVSCEDITSQFSGKEYPDLVRGALSEVKLRSYAIDDAMKNSWRELHEAEKKRFCFFDELFAMGHVVDSLEVLSPPPKDTDGVPITTGEYFVEADERHYRKKVDYGRVVFKTKHVYTGNFQDWYFQGPGRYCWQDGTVYQGEFSKGVMHGPGSIHWPDGSIYEGHFIYGKRTGWGVYTSADGQNTYAGEWLNGLPHGHGKMWYDPNDDDNDYYEGQWKRGLPEGVGTRQYATGDRYIGNWIEGMRNSYGTMIWLQERQVYKGEWLDGVPHGTGKHIWYLERSATNSFPTRHVYQGSWIMGRREGIGKMVYPCGSIYEGRWKNGQRHGKGMFMNPAGDLLVGLFRAGAILGGSDVPLYAPTYDCDYVGLTDWLIAKFKLPFSEIADNEEEKLNEITKQYLPYLRKLYHRAGEYSQKYGRHGLYPAYLKKSDNNSKTPTRTAANPLEQQPIPTYSENTPEHHHVHPKEYSRLDEPEHMKGKVEKPESLDGVNPVTRFGLWLLLRDCDNVLDEVTMAYYDKIWCEMPPLSFQTRHNPFEPIYLWQFLQALIATSVAYCVDVPRLRQHAKEREKRPEMEPVAVSDTTLQGGVSQAEQKRAMIVHKQRTSANSQYPHFRKNSMDEQTTTGKVKGKHKSSRVPGRDDWKSEKKHSHRKHGDHGKETHVEIGTLNGNASLTLDKINNTRASDMEMDVENNGNNTNNNDSASEGGAGKRPPSEVTEKISKSLKTKGSSGKKKMTPRTSGTEEEMDSLGEEDEEEEEEEDGDDDVFASEGQPCNQCFTGSMSISECFETFISTKLLPSLRREAGSNLPVMPQPLPALVDMYDAFKSIKQRDIIRGKEFFRSALPHLLFPNSKDALWWHRCPEPLSHQVDVEELLIMFREKFESVQEDTELDENFEEKFESEYLGAQAQNSEMTLALLKLCKEDPNAPECPPPGGVGIGGHIPILPVVDSQQALKDIKADEEEALENMTALMDFTTDGQPFAEEELVPEPFLWADDYKCVPVRRKYQHFENINSKDVFHVIQQLYPRLCTGKHDKDLQFELIFCDWLWCISLLAKTSTERECREAWRTKEDMRPFTNPQSLGVYAHYVKLIKNNPYLSPHPPPDFRPKRKSKQNYSPPTAADIDEKKAVKFT